MFFKHADVYYAVLVSLGCCTGEEKGFVSNLGWDAGAASPLPVRAAGLGHPHRAIFQGDICDTALDRARRVANSSSARAPAPRPNNFPG